MTVCGSRSPFPPIAQAQDAETEEEVEHTATACGYEYKKGRFERGGDPMATEMRKTGIDVIGDMPWGTHFLSLLRYESGSPRHVDLILQGRIGKRRVLPVVVAEPLKVGEAIDALQNAMPDIDRYLADSSIEIVSAGDWYLQGGTFDLKRVTLGWHEKLIRASVRGYRRRESDRGYGVARKEGLERLLRI